MDSDRSQRAGDRETLQLLIDGDARGIARLLADHGGLVHAYVERCFRSHLRSWQIDEAVSLAMIRVWESAPRLELRGSTLRAWFAAIALNRAITLIWMQDGGDSVPVDGVDPAALGMWASRADARRLRLTIDVERALMTLPADQRAILSRDLDAGTTLPATVHAERLGVSTATIDALRSAGRRALRKQLQKLGHYVEDRSSDENGGRRRNDSNTPDRTQ